MSFRVYVHAIVVFVSMVVFMKRLWTLRCGIRDVYSFPYFLVSFVLSVGWLVSECWRSVFCDWNSLLVFRLGG